MLGKLKGVLQKTRRFELHAAFVLISILIIVLMNNGAGVFGTEKSVLECRLEDLLRAIDGIHGIEAMINQAPSGEITGVVIVAGGIADYKTYLSIQNAVKTLLNIELSRIQIIVQR